MQPITGREQRVKATAKLKLLKRKLRQAMVASKRLEKEIYKLDSKVWDLELALVKPEEMCRRAWRFEPGCYCSLKRGHNGSCQGMAPELVRK
jgi:hypothetical protein